MPKPDADTYTTNLSLYEKLVATNPDVKRKGDTMPYTSLNGHMFSVLTKEGALALRLPADAREAFLKKYKAKLCDQYGIVMKEYVEVPNAMLKKTKELQKYFELSVAYIASLNFRPCGISSTKYDVAADKTVFVETNQAASKEEVTGLRGQRPKYKDPRSFFPKLESVILKRYPTARVGQ